MLQAFENRNGEIVTYHKALNVQKPFPFKYSVLEAGPVMKIEVILKVCALGLFAGLKSV